MARVLLILPSSTYRAAEFLGAAARLDVEVVTASEERQALATMMGDRFVQLPIDDAPAAAELIAEFAARVPLDAVLAVDDRGALAAAIAAERLGLRGSAPAAVAATTDKTAIRALLAASGVAQPAHRVLAAGPGRGQQLQHAARELGYPLVLKPVSLSASRGVIRADDQVALELAAKRIEAILASCGRSAEPLLLESFIPGDEVALEGLLEGGVLQTLCLFDKPDPLEGPFFEETIYVTPSRQSPSLQQQVGGLVAEACRALGLTEGPVHAEVRLQPNGGGRRPVLIEVAARTIGGRCAKTIQFATGRHLEELVLEHALGRASSGASLLPGAAGVMMLPIPSSGRLVEVRGREAALAVTHIVGLEVAVPLGRHLVALPEGDRYLGFLFAAGPDPATVEGALREAHANLEVEIAADLQGATR